MRPDANEDRPTDEERLARIYDPFEPDRSDLDVYAALVDELGGRSVLDLGCGTGSFACLLASRGVSVIGVDPDGASLAVARGKPDADRIRWIEGDGRAIPVAQVDVVTMTANAAQCLLTDDEWRRTLADVHRALRPGGHFVFETRDPARKAWLAWTREETHSRSEVPGLGMVEAWVDTIDVDPPLVTIQGTYTFEADGTVLTPTETLRFRSRDEVEQSLVEAGFTVTEVRDAPDRPGREFVFLARRPD